MYFAPNDGGWTQKLSGSQCARAKCATAHGLFGGFCQQKRGGELDPEGEEEGSGEDEGESDSELDDLPDDEDRYT